jgi:hypothetical protein
MSHHYSGPAFRFRQGDARLDFTDLYAFPKPGDTPFRTALPSPAELDREGASQPHPLQ